MQTYNLFLKFLRFIKPYWGQEILLFVLMVLVSAGTLVSPYVLKIIIDDIIPSGNLKYLLQILAILVTINLVRILIGFCSDYLYTWVSNHIMLDIRKELFNRILHFPVGFFDKNKTGDVTHRINEEVNNVQGMLTGSLMRFIRNTLTLAGLAVALCLLNWKLFLVSMVVLPFVIINTRHFQPGIHKLYTQSREKDADVLDFFGERFNNIKLIKTFNRYQFENLKLTEKIKDLISLNLKSTIQSSTTQSISTFLISLSPLIVFAWGGQQVITGAMSLGALIAFIQYLNRIFNPVNDSMGLYWDVVRTSVSMKRIFEFMELPTEKLFNDHGNRLKLNTPLTFENITFKYENTYIFENFNLSLTPGKSYAIVGSSGCGKSTLINLLCRFYEPEKGCIRFGINRIEEFDIHELRNRIALISQEVSLFRGSIAENIQYGDLQSDIKHIEHVARLAGLSNMVNETIEGLNSNLGNEGAKISGGQKQRIAIARALLKDSDIIILDESTSAMDSECEKEILENIFRLFKAKIIILISHRLSAISYVDEIICLHKGRIAEKGNHSDLIARKGYYLNLVKQQLISETV